MSGSSNAHLLRTRLAGLLAAALLLVGLAACSKSSDASGDGFRLSASQLLESTTSSTAPRPAYQTDVVTANVPVLEVFAEKPNTPITGQPAALTFGEGAQHPPIPRQGFNSAGARKTDAGWAYDNPTYWGKPLTMVVTGREGDWIKVLIPARPNHQEGWVRASDVSQSSHNFHGELVLGERHLTVWDGDTVMADTPVVVGKDSTPTPTGTFYIAEILDAATAGVSPGGAYGPYILPTNGYSESMDLFDNGLPVIAFHGTNQPELLGSAASNGCIRMPNDVVTKLAETITPGTPIEIKP